MPAPWEKYASAQPAAAPAAAPWQRYAQEGPAAQPAPAQQTQPVAPQPDNGIPVLGLTPRQWGGLGETALQFGTGAIATPLSGLAGLAGAALPGEEGQGSRAVERVQNMLTYQPRGKEAQDISRAVSQPLEMYERGADFAGQVGADVTGSPAVGTSIYTALQSVPAALTRRAPTKAGAPAASPLVHPAVKQAQDAGIVLQPSQVVGGKPVGGLGKRLAERGGGKADLPAEASLRNQKRTVELVAEDIGLKKGDDITPAAVDRLRKDANTKYEALQNVDVKLEPDVDFFYGIHEIRQASVSPVKGGGPDPRVNKLLNQYQTARGRLDVGDVMEEVRRLRFDARKNMGAEKPETVRLGESQRKIADLMEDLIDRQVSPKHPQAVQEWRGARQQLAKLHLIDDALKGTEIDATVFAKALKRGDPLTGNLRALAEIADNFPQVMQTGARLGSKAGVGLLDIALSVPTAGLWALGREGSKRLALRKPSPPSRVRATPVAAAGTQAATEQRRSINQFVPGY